MLIPPLILISGDILNALVALLLAFSMRFGVLPRLEDQLMADSGRVITFILVVLFVSFLMDIYNTDKNLKNRENLSRLPLIFAGSFFMLSALYYMIPFLQIGRGLLAFSLGVFVALQFLWHLIYNNGNYFKGLSHRVLVLGTGPLAGEIGGLIKDTNHNHILTGYFSCPYESVNVSSDEVLAAGEGLLETAEREKTQKIVVSISDRRSGGLPLKELLDCKFSGIEVIDAPSFYEQLTGKILLENITAGWFVFSGGFKHTLFLRFIKKATDKILAVMGLIITLPLMLLIAMLIKVSSPGPVFFRQVRVGKREKPFVLYKFRTMRADAEAITGAVWARQDDPRVTAVGSFLRKSRLDEIPQLYNVLKGDMSFIGPRPERPEFVEKLKQIIPFYSERHFVKPGLTGWAQVKYAYGASVEDAIEKLKYDLYYIKNLSLTLEIQIILETIKVVIYGRGSR